ncbi:uncharacterized protein SPSK_06404 [Sporothrix schenckii 1099-18]|uniref:Uncharacterized protein n=2 Tax=Sporothrix schenckii TaxID=29908 RepID=U7PR80_SPOS1|nr:uncharacterized protein SPSK_06404 [Sporothrix schenckii 1099-18]ERS98102.1 hypothetical protein HMPREF1624_04881 [Sporothrix schenckii ATCC 58251]KJR89814.1 hypothetical protein SPSK_06404 [Sporothrix schenckii 1099-18]
MESLSATTLRDALVRQKPFVPCTSRRTGNTKYAPWPEPNIRVWSEFNIQTLNDSYGHVLDTALPRYLVDNLTTPADVFKNMTVSDDKAPLHFIGWNDATVMPLVKWSMQQMGLHTGTALFHRYTDAQGTTVAKLPQAPNKLTVDHLVYLQNSHRDTLVVGLGRTSTKWRGVAAMRNPGDARGENTWPIRQLANLCARSGTRYGYIQTDEELAVCCFGAKPPTSDKADTGARWQQPDDKWDDWSVSLMVVPWNTELCGSGDASGGGARRILTTELALWWLCMLALSDGHRPLVETKEIVAIDSWERVYLHKERRWVRRHRYSSCEVPADPPPPSAYETPEPGNAATLAADVGANGQNWFDLIDPATIDITGANFDGMWPV